MRISDAIARHVENLITVNAVGEPLTYEVIPTMLPTPGGPKPVWVVMVVGRSLALDEAIAGPLITIDKPDATEEQLKPHVLNAIRQIKAAKQKLATGAPDAPKRQPQRTPAGLYIN
ncbi:hypothetical protein GCM10009555_017680 [Acrocarpospora macrocephala]|uniref:Uncharacterized protein n=1 Tax=Acrocarpospora macrocephala TaxID=150177 RepID=A0A5M3WM81_9ACTN|nr:hypothetical protein [Acrocarpospora macrocephala]GES07428.1 hypothetical protein Amac_010230 [Acrocarpospora macrocephala]